MDIKSSRIIENIRDTFSSSHRAVRGLYVVLFWIVLGYHSLVSILTWLQTVMYRGFCGNPLMATWSRWCRVSVFAGLILLPGGVLALRHRDERFGIVHMIGFLLYIASVLLMLVVSIRRGTLRFIILAL